MSQDKSKQEDRRKGSNDRRREDWIDRKWRPIMAVIYAVVCVFDFVLFPIMWSGMQAYMKTSITQWSPLTLQGAGLFHLSMGAVLGIAAYGRTKEKTSGVIPSSLMTDNLLAYQQNQQTAQQTQPMQPTQYQPVTTVSTYQTMPVAQTAQGKKIVPLESHPLI